jgi:NitT/TauT family transport system substrate-binding protein
MIPSTLLGKRRVPRIGRGVTLAIALVMVISACGGAAGPAGPATQAGVPAASSAPTTAEKVKVTMILDYLPSVAHLGFVEAVAQGFYAAQGLTVETQPGRGSAGTAQFVGANQANFGFADGGAMATGIANGLPVKMVAGLFQAGANNIVFYCDSGIKNPADLSGKTVGGPAGAAGFVALTAAMEKAGLKDKSYKNVAVAPEAKADALLSGQINAMTATVYDLSLHSRLEAQGKKLCDIPISDWGIPMMGQGIITTDSMIKDRPDIVQKFVTASLQGWEAAVKDPDRAIADLLKQFPDAVNVRTSDAWKKIPPMFHTPASKDQKLGWMATEDWKTTLALLTAGGLVPKPLQPEQVFTNQFIK